MHLTNLTLTRAAQAAAQPGTVAGVNVDAVKNIFLYGVIPIAGLLIAAGIIFAARKQKASDNAVTLTNVLIGLAVAALCTGGAAWAIASAAASQIAPAP